MASAKKPDSGKAIGEPAGKSSSPYLVLARKYRPLDFSAMIGQDAMVQTLSNAFKTGRIHHAFILTGVRGVGKTTTARILARAFNYVGKDGPQPTLDLSTPGEHCEAIIEGRHVDVIEMDAASNTGIDDVREIIDSVRYGPVSAPYKVYIIDEVHMLSRQAFNGLLKTLEEPPPYVKFIFATTEIRKVPVTILSRCQRFDLRRIPPDTMSTYLQQLLEKEGLSADADAMSMIVRAGEGSVRDCLSLLDQAIAFGDGKITGEAVQSMLGLADRSKTIDLFTAVMQGDVPQVLDVARALYDAGADPQVLIADLAELTHLVTRMKAVAETADDHALTPDERTRGAELASRLSMRALTRAWQMLQSGLNEVTHAANAMQAAEMVLIRLAYAADMPTPDELIAKLSDMEHATPAPASPSLPPASSSGHVSRASGGASAVSQARAQPRQADPQPDRPAVPSPQSFADLIALSEEHRDLVVKHALETYIRPLSFEPGRMRIGLTDDADVSIVSTINARLQSWTGRTWMISVDNVQDGPATIAETRQRQQQDSHSEAAADPLVRAVLDAFPKSKIVNVRVRDAAPLPAPDAGFADDDDPDQEEDI